MLQKILQAKLEEWQRLLIKLGLSADEFRLWNNVRSQLMQITVKVANELSNPNAGLYYYNVYAQGINSGTFKYEYDRKQSLAIHRESLEAARNQFKSKQTIDIKKKHKAKQSCRICGQSSHPFWQCPRRRRKRQRKKVAPRSQLVSSRRKIGRQYEVHRKSRRSTRRYSNNDGSRQLMRWKTISVTITVHNYVNGFFTEFH